MPRPLPRRKRKALLSCSRSWKSCARSAVPWRSRRTDMRAWTAFSLPGNGTSGLHPICKATTSPRHGLCTPRQREWVPVLRITVYCLAGIRCPHLSHSARRLGGHGANPPAAKRAEDTEMGMLPRGGWVGTVVELGDGCEVQAFLDTLLTRMWYNVTRRRRRHLLGSSSTLSLI